MPRIQSLLALACATLLGCANEAKKPDETPRPDAQATSQAKPTGGLKELKIEDVKKGDDTVLGVKIKGSLTVGQGDRVSVLYRGTLMDGKEFDSNMKPDRDPLTFIVGAGEVIKGWEQGLMGMRIGGERKLAIPTALGYGDKGAGGVIPPNADLKFTVRVLDIVKAGQDDVYDKSDIKVGSGRAVKIGDKIGIEYTGSLVNGKAFDSNVGGKPFTFEVTADDDPVGVIAGINAGVKGMKKGGTRLIRIPPMLGYGEPGTEGIPPFSTLVFKVRILSIS